MNRYEKVAWFNLAVIAASIVLYFILFLYLRTKYDLFLSAQVAISAFSIIALCAFGPLMFSKRKRDSVVIIDEQGTIIRQKKIWYKYVLLGAVYLSIFFGIWIWTKIAGTISDQVTVLIVFFYVSIFTFIGFTFYWYLKRQKESRLIADEHDVTDVILYGPDMDERDLKIQRTARWSGFGIFWVFYIFGIMGTWEWARHMGYRSISIDISVLPLFVFGAMILIFVVDSITKIILYRRGK